MAGSPFSKSPLFSAASQGIQSALRRDFRRTTLGQMLSEAESVARGPSGQQRLTKIIEKYKRRLSPDSALRDLYRTELGSLAKEIERYSREGGIRKRLVSELFGVMGPAGKILKTLLGNVAKKNSTGLSRELDAATNLLRAFGYEVLPPPSQGGNQRAVSAAQKFLEATGHQVTKVDQEPESKLPFGISDRTSDGRQRKVVDVQYGGETRRFPVNSPVVTGEMQRATNSSNVHSYGYDIEAEYLYIRFLAPDPNNPGKKTDAPGPIYRYAHVPPEIFERMHKASSKGKFIWDNIRIRGTVSGHRYDYQLSGVTNGYVPRKATLTPAGEAYLRRRVRGDSGSILTSRLGDELVRPLSPRGPTTRGPTTRGPGRPR